MRSILSMLEQAVALAQGKGYGSNSVHREVQAAASLLRKEARLVMDVGGNKGTYVQAVRTRFPDAEIHVFEPAQSNLEILRNAFARDSTVTIQPFALGNQDGEATLHADVPGSGLGSLSNRRVEHHGIDFEHQEAIAIRRFEAYWRQSLQSRAIDLAKLDVEGHELAVLHGFGAAIAQTAVIQFEFGGCNIDTRTYFQDFWYFFREHGFDVYRIAPLTLQRIARYSEIEESFMTTNFLAVNRAAASHN